MRAKAISKTEYFSWKMNNLASGCKQCVKGCKLVVFITGICPKNCFYCPLSEQKKNKDVIYANERQLSSEEDIDGLLEEARCSRSFGASFTGGDPLSRIERTCKFIKILKKEFKEKFHVHLYTIMESLTEQKLKMLDDAGLDELRLHPDIADKKYWNNINLLFNHKNKHQYKFDIGIEIPSVPDHKSEITALMDYFLPKVDFLNINELEISDTNYFQLKNKEFSAKNHLSYGVLGSEELALELLQYASTKYPNKNIHYCTCKLKDAVQLKERLKRRANNIKRDFDIVTEDGTIIRGVLYLRNFTPGYSYIKKLKALKEEDKINMLKELEEIKIYIINNYNVPANMIEVDNLKFRIITNIGIAQELAKPLKSQRIVCAVVEQYPSYDQMEVDVEFL